MCDIKKKNNAICFKIFFHDIYTTSFCNSHWLFQMYVTLNWNINLQFYSKQQTDIIDKYKLMISTNSIITENL